jgi:hypothetical protein
MSAEWRQKLVSRANQNGVTELVTESVLRHLVPRTVVSMEPLRKQ